MGDDQPGWKRYRHTCADCRSCNGDATHGCTWAEFCGGTEGVHLGGACPGATCGQPWAGCHHCGAPTPCAEPCWVQPRDADGNLMLFEVAA